MRMYLITRHIHKHHDDDVEKNVHHAHDEHSKHSESDIFDIEHKSCSSYINKHGYHFTDNLAEHACSDMINADGSSHRWTTEEIKNILHPYGEHAYRKCTLGDMTYLANMAYADFYPNVIHSEDECIEYAIATANDPDGYEGIVFLRWMADIIGKKITTIEWDKYI